MCDSWTIITLDELDTDRILRALYNGTRPAKVHTLVCACGAIADLRVSPKAWNGWQIVPFAKCPSCIAKGQAPQLAIAECGEIAQQIFRSKLEELVKKQEIGTR